MCRATNEMPIDCLRFPCFSVFYLSVVLLVFPYLSVCLSVNIVHCIAPTVLSVYCISPPIIFPSPG